MTRDLKLGRTVDPSTGAAGSLVTLASSDLTTHGLIVGMTGSGKTALGIVLIEELLLSGVPVLAIDPKGDLGNLALAFPGLSAAEFAPWVDTSTGATPESEAKKWADGLGGWGYGRGDVASLAEARDVVLYTPGSTAGVPIDLLGSCVRPEGGDDEDRRDVIGPFVAGLLGLIGVDADPVRSREFILLSRCVEAIWETEATATLEALLRAAATPPFPSVGALPLETFFPAKERHGLVLALNGLLASPSTAAFRSGEPLDVGRMLTARPGGKTPLSIVSIAHLGDGERLFVVATLLSRVKAWMRSQPGSSSLRALVYVDEIFGFFPPSAEPPTKKPLLTLLKQARAFGVGVVLASQNPVDLDYKGLANCGCWWVGTLQTERDRQRLADGLTSATGSTDAVDLLPKTKKRVFLLHDVHRKGSELVETRWAMSYLRGPMTREEIGRLKPAPAPGGPPPLPSASSRMEDATEPPPLPSGLPARWVERRGADIASPHLFVKYAVRYKVGTASAPEVFGVKLFPLSAASAGEALEGDAVDVASDDLVGGAPRRVRYAPLPEWFGAAATKSLEKAVRERLPDKLATTLLKDPITGAVSRPGETPDAFSARLAGTATATAPMALRERLEKKRRDLAAAEASEKGRQVETIASGLGAAVDILGGLFGGKKTTLKVGKVGSVLSKRRMEANAEGKVEALKAEIEELEAKLAPPDADRFVPVEVVPAKTQIDLLSLGIAWVI